MPESWKHASLPLQVCAGPLAAACVRTTGYEYVWKRSGWVLVRNPINSGTHCPRVSRVRVETSSRTNGSRVVLSLFPDFSCAPSGGRAGGNVKAEQLIAYPTPSASFQGNSEKIFRRLGDAYRDYSNQSVFFTFLFFLHTKSFPRNWRSRTVRYFLSCRAKGGLNRRVFFSYGENNTRVESILRSDSSSDK